MDKFLPILNRHITAFEHLHDIENVALAPRQNKIMPKANSPPSEKARPTKGTTDDANFYHRCIFCTRLDQNDRGDAAVDHMQKVHNYYGKMEYRLRRARELVHQKRKDTDVLKTLITKERAVFNSLVTRLHEAKMAVAALEGNRHRTIPRLRDVERGDLGELGRLQLAEKLCAERAPLVDRELDGEVCEMNNRAWEIVLRLEEFDWAGTPDI